MKSKRSIIALFISLIFLALVFYNVDFRQLILAFKLFDYKVLGLIGLINISALALRGLRWKYFLPDNKEYKITDLGGIYTVGSTMNILLPARAGDFFRAYYLGDSYKKDKVQIFGSIVLERIFDGISVLMILFSATMLYHTSALTKELNIIAATLFLGSFTVFYILFKFNKTDTVCSFLKSKSTRLPEKISIFLCKIIDKINQLINSFIKGFESLNSPKNIVIAGLLSIAIWTLECIMVYQLITHFGYQVSFSIALFAVSFIALSTIIPSTSIFIGPYQYAFVLAMGMYFIDKNSALAIAFVLQTVTIIILTTISIVFILKNNINYKQYKNQE